MVKCFGCGKKTPDKICRYCGTEIILTPTGTKILTYRNIERIHLGSLLAAVEIKPTTNAGVVRITVTGDEHLKAAFTVKRRLLSGELYLFGSIPFADGSLSEPKFNQLGLIEGLPLAEIDNLAELDIVIEFGGNASMGIERHFLGSLEIHRPAPDDPINLSLEGDFENTNARRVRFV